ncbi:uncharacterized protein K452DRAFT_64131 [Aplosporella prunicola CBS 121167]|uniref:Uncharacterized protein n=1 Tax=Aplosporella prunicola CBS 121167 TaxID=1176127 RepID=A0A6A6B8K1_9PEZI|nr:uncharacterized protein K452DRAFT_64131 [Aplosporella prunicola CBS 121167]KAF2139683.1 hypothetical protein K452DRAFT_64131 [Aplosporella prunicola CBS 121167]
MYASLACTYRLPSSTSKCRERVRKCRVGSSAVANMSTVVFQSSGSDGWRIVAYGVWRSVGCGLWAVVRGGAVWSGVLWSRDACICIRYVCVCGIVCMEGEEKEERSLRKDGAFPWDCYYCTYWGQSYACGVQWVEWVEGVWIGYCRTCYARQLGSVC